MMQRTDLLTASRVDLALILLPEIGWVAAAVMLALSEVPEEVAARVLALPGARRAVAMAQLPATPEHVAACRVHDELALYKAYGTRFPFN